ncbi:hypothetical protein [Sapientia aquatica]|uniref:Uncharacterized protein n=1 Tax=Sapientia aquatica TaxID=1549640 RepID=A0A4R5W1K7_9BURK|nr:hypothetical protein [Sapientia aquatica]TDK65962.1 hypothetical protein E2I14_10225 [Sapientia aquatica]
MNKLYFSLSVLALTVIVTACYLYSGNYIGAYNTLSWGLFVSLCIQIGFVESLTSVELKLVATLLTAVSFGSTMLASRAADDDLQKAHVEAVNLLFKLNESCNPFPEKIKNISTAGVYACSTQSTNDSIDLVLDVSRGKNMGPRMSFLDSVTSLWDEPKVDQCAKLYKATFDTCPNEFVLVNKDSHKVLMKAAN